MAVVAAALVVAAVDWWAVAGDRARTEYWAKPMVMVLLIVAVVLDGGFDGTVTALVAVAFGWSLVGDVVLMLPGWPFEGGLSAFLVAHLCTIAAFLVAGLEPGLLVVGVVLVGGAALALAPPVVRAAAAHATVLGWAVAAYIVVLGAMSALGVGVGHWATIAGGLLFLASDALLGWGRFVGPAPGDRVAVHVTYHLAQAAFATWVITA